MIIEFDESTPLHVIKELAPGLRLEDKTVELSIPELEEPSTVKFNVDFGKDPVSFVVLSYNDVPLDPQNTGHGSFLFDPNEFGHTLKIEFNTTAIPTPKQEGVPAWEGQINFQVEGDDEWSAFFIQVEKFLGDETFDGVFAIDLGTTNSSVAYWEVKPEPDFLPVSPILMKEAQSIASAVNVLEIEPFKQLAPESYDIGQAAVGAPRKTNLHMSVKRGIGTNKRYVVTKGKEIWRDADAQHMMTALGKKILEDARSVLGKNIDEIVATSPPRWNAVQVNELRRVFRRLGFQADRIDMSTDEATASGLYYVLYPLFERFGKSGALKEYIEKEFGRMKTADGGYRFNLLSMDFGGGTTDLALIKVGMQFLPQHLALDIDIVDRGGRQDIGGDNLTLFLFDLLKRRLALALCHPQRLIDPSTTEQAPSNPWIKKFKLDVQQGALLQRWDEVVEHLNAPQLPRDLWELVNGVFFTAWDFKDMPATYRKYKLPARRNFDWLWAQADTLKKALCVDITNELRGKNVTVADLEPFHERWLSPDLEDYIEPVNLAECIPMAAESEEFREKFLSINFGQICNFYVPVIKGLAEETVRMEARSLESKEDGSPARVDRVVLAGNGARIPIIGALVHEPRDKGGLGTSFEQIKFDPVRAKLAVPIGACLRRIARKVEGFKIDIRISRNLLPFQIFLNMGTTSAELFPAGQIDEFYFFQRKGISEDLEVEFVTRLEESDAGTENFKPYVLFKPKGEHLELVDLQKEEDLWKTLDQTYGLVTIPKAKKMVGGAPFNVFDPSNPGSTGSNRIAAAEPEKVFKEVGERKFTYGEMLEILRNELTTPQKIAWMEEAFSERPAEGEIVHRYYLDVTKQVYLVRDHYAEGKKLFMAETDEEALEELPPERNPFSGMH
ncbi:MAG: hypothetical protein D6731_24925 [Planctomycetota bacterium]|nr:MAG: hypothetical protein D6731_24925 [Planctomycetota bacterium]